MRGRNLTRLARNQRGQSILEYIILTAVAAGISLLIGSSFKRVQDFLWMSIACDVTAACPGCPPLQKVVRESADRAPGACRAR